MAEKLSIVKESFEDGAVVSHVAQRHGLSPQQLFGWRRAIREQVLASPEPKVADAHCEAAFVPIAVASTPPTSAIALKSAVSPASIEIELHGATVRLSGPVDGKMLASVLKALRVLR
jgi:transposase